ncbi:protein FAR1-RELATED SEQUENCE 8-like [Carica papaya]|uniref:protein FAR1-RELATED SEQUENCE 8-like n=1 Tax=Carica papaya TaxID=3649 RepID=UPI000B8CC55F|nr:protein FAR1-RELATED SEQUENCE 8-like [Carica papaya]
MESNSNLKVPFDRDAIDSCCNNRVENGKEEEHGAGGLNGDEVGPPCVGMVFASQDEVRSYYSKYAQREGFGIMRRSSRCREDGKLTYFILACAQSGKTRSIAKKRFQFRQLTKTNCKAKINVVVEPEGCVHICNVVLEHNHELSPGKKQRNICKRSGTPRNKRKYALEELVGAPVQLDSRLASRESWAPLNLPSAF